MDPGDTTKLLPADSHGQIGPPQPPWSVAEALGTRSIPTDLSGILEDRSWTVCKYGASLSLEKRSVWEIHYFLTQLALGMDIFPGLDRVTLARFDLGGVVHLLHSLFSVWVDL